MPRAPRLQFAGAYYHVYNRGVAKQGIVQDDRDRKTFLQLLGEAVRDFELRLFAYCLMGNHFHLFLKTEKANLDQAMQSLEGQYAHFVNLRYDRVGPLFQGRYKSRLVDKEAYGLLLVRYIHQNPIEAGLVQRPEDYPWSSYPCYVGKLPKWNWLDTHWVLGLFHEDRQKSLASFIEFHQQKPLPAQEKLFAKFRGALGSKEFRRAALAETTKLVSSPQKGSDPFSEL